MKYWYWYCTIKDYSARYSALHGYLVPVRVGSCLISIISVTLIQDVAQAGAGPRCRFRQESRNATTKLGKKKEPID